MKKLMMAVAAFGMLLTSCQNDLDFVQNAGETSTVSFSVGTPEIATRAYSDGLTAKVLQYAVYDSEGNILSDLTETDATINGSTTVNLQLTTGDSYAVIFWAAAENAPYTVNFDTKTMTVSYDGAKSNDEARDAFYKYHTFTVTGAQTETVELRRPFAQLNIGTSDYTASENAGYVPTTSAVTVKNVYTTLSLADGAATGETEAVFAANAIPEGEQFPVAGYEYLAMNYLLINSEKEVVDVEFTYEDANNDAKTRTVGSVPVKRNHRTNIYGQLLTSDVDIYVEINPEYDEPAYDIYNVVVDGISYNDFAVAVAKALELNKPVEFIQNVSIDADNTITVPEGQNLTLNLNGYTLQGVTDDADKNDDGKITSVDNEVMFDVRGEMNVNNGRVVIKHINDYANFAWNACGEIFYVGFNGTLNVKDAHLENEGGVPMAYAIDLVNATNVTLNVDNSALKSSYIPVRVFNNGAGMNNVTIKNSTLEGTSRAFWVHIYSKVDDQNFFKNGKDANGNSYKDETLNINIYNPECNNKFIANNPERIIEYGFDNEVNFDEFGNQLFALAPVYYDVAETEVVDGVGMIDDTTYGVTNANGLAWIAAQLGGNTLDRTDIKKYEVNGNTVMLLEDIDLFKGYMEDGDPMTTAPIGDKGEAFTGVFDGQGHSIKNLYQNGWALGYEWGVYGSLGLFRELDGATVKNVVIEDMLALVEGGDISFIAGSATGNCVFENIEIKNSTIGTYNNGCGGIIGWSGDGEYTFKNIKLAEDVVLGGLWGSFDSSIGGIVGQAEPGATYKFENVEINCRIDAYNDCTASYDYYNYRMCGMIIGRCEETTTIDGVNYPDLSKYNLTFNNVVVNYGDWMNYHYCRKSGERAARVEAGYAYDGIAEDRDHSTDDVHCMECIPFNQLIGGDQFGVKGLPAVDGVTVNYPASFNAQN